MRSIVFNCIRFFTRIAFSSSDKIEIVEFPFGSFVNVVISRLRVRAGALTKARYFFQLRCLTISKVKTALIDLRYTSSCCNRAQKICMG